jgi:hypothetical protein
MSARLPSDDDVADVVEAPGGSLVPASTPGDAMFGQSTTFRIEADRGARFLSLASMLICTNDGFMGVNALKLPSKAGDSVTVETAGYDAGTELNTEDFAGGTDHGHRERLIREGAGARSGRPQRARRGLAPVVTRAHQQPEVGHDEGHQVVEHRLRKRRGGGVPAGYHIGVVDRGEDGANHDRDHQRATQVLRLEDDA